MATKLITNILKRSKDVLRWAGKTKGKTIQPQRQHVQAEVKQPVSDLVQLQPLSIRTRIFNSRVCYRTLASQLRRRAAFNFGRSSQIPIFAFVGLAIANSQQEEEHERLSTDIRDAVRRHSKLSSIIQELSLQSFELGEFIGSGCNSSVYAAKWKDAEKPREPTLPIINEIAEAQVKDIELLKPKELVLSVANENVTDQETTMGLQEAVEEHEEDKWFPPTENQEDALDYVTNDDISTYHVTIAEETDKHVIKDEMSDQTDTFEEETNESFCIINETDLDGEMSEIHSLNQDQYNIAWGVADDNFEVILIPENNDHKTFDKSFSLIDFELDSLNKGLNSISMSFELIESESKVNLTECSLDILDSDKSSEMSFCIFEDSDRETSSSFSNSSTTDSVECEMSLSSISYYGSESSLSGEEFYTQDASYLYYENESSLSGDETDVEDDNDIWIPPDSEKSNTKDFSEYGVEEEATNTYDLAIKMMYNYGVESKAESIMKAMEKEAVPARIPIYQAEDNCWFSRNRTRLKSLPQHPNVVDMIGAFVDSFHVPELSVAMEICPAALPKRLSPDGHGRNMTMYLVMKRYNMTLRQYLKQHNPDTQTRCLLLAQLLEGIVHLGNHGVAHRDIKSDNLFLEFSEGAVPHLVIGDFGCCLADEEFGQKIPYQTNEVDKGGNCSLMAPEISTAFPAKNAVLDFSKADLWAVGTLIYEIFSMENPFYGNNNGQNTLDSRTYRECDLPTLPDSVPEVVRQLCRTCLSRDPNKRPSPVDAANIMQLYLWFPEVLNWPHTITEIKDKLLILTARLVFLNQPLDEMAVDDQLKWTFLRRLQIHDLLKFYE